MSLFAGLLEKANASCPVREIHPEAVANVIESFPASFKHSECVILPEEGPTQSTSPWHAFQRVVVCLSILLISVCLAGCAGVTVTPLSPTGMKVKGEVEGLRYYMPRPYLLVVELPPVVSTNSPKAEEIQEDSISKDTDKAKTPSPKNDGTASDSSDPSSSAKSSSPVSDTSFMAATPQYMVKLIYLPDLAHPMAMSENTGLFGTSEMKPVLQDGWMLTSLDATADSKVAETLTAVAAIAGAAMGTGSGGGAGKAAAKNAASIESIIPHETHILRPGLYRFEYDKDGLLIGLTPLQHF